MGACAGGSSNGRTPGSGPGNGGSSPPPPAIFVSRVARDAQAAIGRPHRLEAQDTALSRLKHGFESRWGHHREMPEKLGETAEKREVAQRLPIPPKTPRCHRRLAIVWQSTSSRATSS